jgi:hypothetical protein
MTLRDDPSEFSSKIRAPDHPLLRVEGLTKRYGARIGSIDVGFDLFPGEVLGGFLAPTGPMSTRTRATGCGWASAPAAMSASG